MEDLPLIQMLQSYQDKHHISSAQLASRLHITAAGLESLAYNPEKSNSEAIYRFARRLHLKPSTIVSWLAKISPAQDERRSRFSAVLKMYMFAHRKNVYDFALSTGVSPDAADQIYQGMVPVRGSHMVYMFHLIKPFCRSIHLPLSKLVRILLGTKMTLSRFILRWNIRHWMPLGKLAHISGVRLSTADEIENLSRSASPLNAARLLHTLKMPYRQISRTLAEFGRYRSPGGKFRLHRLSIGLSNNDLARFLGVKPKLIRAVEHGCPNYIRPKELRKLKRFIQWLPSKQVHPIDKDQGESLVSALRQRHWNSADLAEHAHISPGRASALCRGAIPNEEILHRIRLAFLHAPVSRISMRPHSIRHELPLRKMSPPKEDTGVYTAPPVIHPNKPRKKSEHVVSKDGTFQAAGAEKLHLYIKLIPLVKRLSASQLKTVNDLIKRLAFYEQEVNFNGKGQ